MQEMKSEPEIACFQKLLSLLRLCLSNTLLSKDSGLGLLMLRYLVDADVMGGSELICPTVSFNIVPFAMCKQAFVRIWTK